MIPQVLHPRVPQLIVKNHARTAELEDLSWVREECSIGDSFKFELPSSQERNPRDHFKKARVARQDVSVARPPGTLYRQRTATEQAPQNKHTQHHPTARLPTIFASTFQPRLEKAY